MKRKNKLSPTKPNELKIQYGAEEGNNPELYYSWGQGIHKTHSLMLMHFFAEIKNSDNRTLVQELERLGYDLTTLNFTITKKSSTENNN